MMGAVTAAYRASDRFKTMKRKAVASWCDRNPKKVWACGKVKRALAQGKLERAKACEVCGHRRTVAHHDDYDQPLVVRWLCQFHHVTWHRENGEGKNAHTPIPLAKSSVYRGVSRDKTGKYQATICVGDARRSKAGIGELDAARLYDEWAFELFGGEAKLNFPRDARQPVFLDSSTAVAVYAATLGVGHCTGFGAE